MRFSPLLVLLFTLTGNPAPARAALGIHAASHFGVGGMGTESPGNPTRSIGSFDLQAMPGWRFQQFFLAGLLADLRFHTQLEEDPVTGGADYGGKSLHLGIGGVFQTGKFKFLMSWDLLNRHWGVVPTQLLKGSGYHLTTSIEFQPNWYIDLGLVGSNYDVTSVAGQNQDLALPNRYWTIDFGISCSY